MTNPSLGRNKKKITITASQKGVELAEKALIRLGFDSKSNFAKSQLLSRSTVTKFFQREPIQLDSFKRICEALKLNWIEIAELSEAKQSQRVDINDCIISDNNEEVKQLQTLRRKVTVIDKKSQTIKAVITLEGDINSVNNWKIIQSAIQEYSGDTIEITDIKEGSIRLFVEGSPEDIERLISRIKSGELKEVSGFPVKDVQILSKSSNDNESNELDNKWHLVQKIVAKGSSGRNLSGADLSDADLSGADLSGADLSGADLSGADLSGANLSGANLIGANLKDANLKDANLKDANLKDANLIGANLKDANLKDANLIGAILIGAILIGAIMTGAYYPGANLIVAFLINQMLQRKAEGKEHQ
ncbi:pentapeptide repeat-containing protein [Nostoc sp. FACHB-190]|uniref:pentapeptide repeat-containing protein n=1 Tax=Nostoc sp. FACHB-190 TaxID=2692838 RepID=UPI001F5528C9|nr:pentapeptide repeat-containing protein [Nostoc sp. FACHB-190]